MPSFYTLETRHVNIGDKESTVRLERQYWLMIAHVALLLKVTPEKLMNRILAIQPTNFKNRTAWVRLWISSKMHALLKESAGDLSKR